MYSVIYAILSSSTIITVSYFFYKFLNKSYRERDIYKNMYLELIKTIVKSEIYTNEISMTMIPDDRLNNVRDLIEIIIKNNIKGDVVECGTWRGGAMAFARSVLNVYNETNRVVHLFDTFSGLTCLTNSKYSYERTWCTHTLTNNNSLEKVKKSFSKLKLLDGVKNC